MKNVASKVVICILAALLVLACTSLQVYAECSPSNKCSLQVLLSDDGTSVVGISGHVAYYDTAYATTQNIVSQPESTRIYNFVFTSDASLINATTVWKKMF